jgi:hypothetical protein
MAQIRAVDMARQAAVDPKKFRQALRDEGFDWHEPNDRWTVEEGSDRYLQMVNVLRKVSAHTYPMVKLPISTP